jgi:hypothetical protein
LGITQAEVNNPLGVFLKFWKKWEKGDYYLW